MGTCKYCGKNAGLFSHAHKECEEKHKQGVSSLETAMRSYLMNSLDIRSLASQIQGVKNNNFITEPDIAISAAKCIDEYTERIHWPFQHKQLLQVQSFMNCIGVPYNTVNVNGSLDRLAMKMIRGFMAEYFTGQKPLQRSVQISHQITTALPISSDKEQEAYYDMLEQASRNFTKDGSLTTSEQQKIDEYVNTLRLSLTQLPAKYQNSDIQMLGQTKILTDLQQGRLPQTGIQAPIILTKDEVALWCYPAVTMYQEKTRREYVGRTGGYSFRIMKGVTYRTGGFRGHPVEHSYMDNMGIGSLYITNKNIIYMGQERSIKVPYKKIIGIQPYSDGMEVQRDGANVKRLIFQGFDCSFVLNVINVINNM